MKHVDNHMLTLIPRAWVQMIAILLAALVGSSCQTQSSKTSNGSQTGAASGAHADHETGVKSGPSNRSGSEAVRINSTKPPSPTPEGMVWVPGGTFWMGCDDCEMPDASPVHLAEVDGFWMDATPVTNTQFAKFVNATGYKTIAERQPDPRDFPGVPATILVPGSAVFIPPLTEVSLDNIMNWWKYVPGASWRHPQGRKGKDGDLEGLDEHPVVQVCWDDAVAYAKWAGKRLPTEAEFEFAARGGLDRAHFAWGDELKPNGKWPANIWQGMFPWKNRVEDGYERTSPVGAYPPNGFGLYDTGGNVWQWCSDWYRPDYFEKLASTGTARNPQGPSDSYDPAELGIPKRVQKSGSFLCSDQYCSRYFVGSRGKGAPDSGGSNTGFRCVSN